jgi:phosphatidylinositol glycan class O
MHSFDHFHIIRQGLLLSIDTFGVSHILPILSLPFIGMVWYNTASKDKKLKGVILNNITQVVNPATLAIKKKHMFWKRFDYTK